METRITAALDGVEFHKLDDALVLQRLEESAPVMNITTAQRASRFGSAITGRERTSLDVTLQFAILEEKNLPARMALLNKVNAWAMKGGYLTTNYRTGQRLRVVCSALPAAGYADEWEGSYTLTFRAFTVPCWEADKKNDTRISSRGATVVISTEGNMETPLRIRAENRTNSTCQTAKIVAAGKTLDFAGLGLAGGETLVIDYGADGLQFIRIEEKDGKTRSAMDKRTAASHDEIMLQGDSRTSVRLSSGVALDWTLSTFGRYL